MDVRIEKWVRIRKEGNADNSESEQAAPAPRRVSRSRIRGGGVNNKVHVYRVTSGYEGATHGHLHRRVEDGDAVAISDAAMEAFQLPLLAVTCSNCRARMR